MITIDNMKDKNQKPVKAEIIVDSADVDRYADEIKKKKGEKK